MMDPIENPKELAEHAISNVGFDASLKNRVGDDVFKEAMKSMKSINKNADAVFGKSSDFDVKEPLHSDLDKVHENVSEHLINPEPLSDQLMNEEALHPPEVTVTLAQTMNDGINHLNSRRPITGKNFPLDMDREPNQHEKSDFNTHASLVENPMQLFRHVKDGSILPEHIQTVALVYPNLLNKMKLALTSKLVDFATDKDFEKLDYNTRYGLSHILGDLDSSMTPQAIMANQQVFGANQVQPPQNAPQKEGKPGDKKMSIAENDETKYQKTLTRTS